VHEFPRDATPANRPTCPSARKRHDAAAAIGGVLDDDWGAPEFTIELAAPTLEVVCPVHGVVTTRHD
jgi:hypothetical protein